MPEIGLAQRLGIQETTLVDVDYEDIPGFQGAYIASDLFQFLHTTKMKFGFVTAFGLEYVLNNERKWRELWQGIAHTTRKDSIIAISPYHESFTIDEKIFSVKNNRNILLAQRIV